MRILLDQDNYVIAYEEVGSSPGFIEASEPIPVDFEENFQKYQYINDVFIYDENKVIPEPEDDSGWDYTMLKTKNLTVTGDVTLTATDLETYGVIYCDISQGNVTITLPDPSTVTFTEETKMIRFIRSFMQTITGQYKLTIKIADGLLFGGLEEQVVASTWVNELCLEIASTDHPVNGSTQFYKFVRGIQVLFADFQSVAQSRYNDCYLDLTDKMGVNHEDNLLSYQSNDRVYLNGYDRQVKIEVFLDLDRPSSISSSDEGYLYLREFNSSGQQTDSVLLCMFYEPERDAHAQMWYEMRQGYYYRFYWYPYDYDGGLNTGTLRIETALW